MREIKFRAWDGNQMSEEFMLSLEGEVLSPETFPFTVRKDVVLMQYTGLKDKNGKEIYEGDIVNGDHWSIESETPCVIKFTDGKFEACMPDSNIAAYYAECRSPEEWEVIGNLYETPNLLET